MNVDEMRKRALAGGGREPMDAARLLAADVLALLAERERIAEEHYGILNAPSVDSAPQMVAGKVVSIEFQRLGGGPIDVAARLIFAWSEKAARVAASTCRNSLVTLVLDAPSAVRAVYAEKERLDALLAALRSVDERELPEHVAAALRAVDGDDPSLRALLSAPPLRTPLTDDEKRAVEAWKARAPADTPATQPKRDPHGSSR